MNDPTNFGAIMHYPEWEGSKEIIAEVQRDAELFKIIKDLKQGIPTKSGFAYRHGVLFYEDKLALSTTSIWIHILLKEFHSTPQGCHSRFYRTYRRVAANVYWVGMKKCIQKFVQECDVCRR